MLVFCHEARHATLGSDQSAAQFMKGQESRHLDSTQSGVCMKGVPSVGWGRGPAQERLCLCFSTQSLGVICQWRVEEFELIERGMRRVSELGRKDPLQSNAGAGSSQSVYSGKAGLGRGGRLPPPTHTRLLQTHTPTQLFPQKQKAGGLEVLCGTDRLQVLLCCAYHLPPTNPPTHHPLRIPGPGHGYAGTLLTTLFYCPTPSKLFWMAIQSFLSPKYRVLYTTLGHFISIPCIPHVPLPLCISHPVSPPLPFLFAPPTSWVLFCPTAAPFLLGPLSALTPPSPPPQARPSPAQPSPGRAHGRRVHTYEPRAEERYFTHYLTATLPRTTAR